MKADRRKSRKPAGSLVRVNGEVMSEREMRKKLDREIFLPTADKHGIGVRSKLFLGPDDDYTTEDFLDDLQDDLAEFGDD